jgi:hypothetical protein
VNDVEIYSGKQWRSKIDDIILMEREAMGGLGPFERDWLLAKAPLSVRDNLVKARRFPHLVAAGSPFASPVGQPSANPSSYTSVNTTNIETNLWTPNIWTPIPANDMVAGKVYKIEAGGILGTSSSPPTATWTPRCGQSATPSSNITLGATTGTTMVASLAAVPWYFTFTLAIRSLGLAASGCTGTGNGYIVIGGLTTATGIVQAMGSTVAATIDNTAATGLILSNTWGTNAAANTVTCQYTTPVYSLN